MPSFARYMPHIATYWAPGVNDGFGALNFAGVTPVLVACRWQNDAKLFRDAQKREAVSDAIVYVDRAVTPGGYLALGDYTATAYPRAVAGAYEVRQAAMSPSLNDDETLHKAWL